MIDWNKSAKLNNTTVNNLKEYFDKFPQSQKRIIAICEGENCEHRIREIRFDGYRNLCQKCACRTLKAIEDNRNRQIIAWSDQKLRDAVSLSDKLMAPKKQAKIVSLEELKNGN